MLVLRTTLVGVLGISLVGIVAQQASAINLINCSSLTPALGQTVTCTAGVGLEDIAIPAGAVRLQVSADGAGGGAGGGIGGQAGGAGGVGAHVAAVLDVTGLTTVRVAVGLKGIGGTAIGGNGGTGGGYSAVWAGASNALGDELVVAGGGGGGGYVTSLQDSPAGGNGAAAGTVAGGSAYDSHVFSEGADGTGAGGVHGFPLCGGQSGSDGATWAAGGAGGATQQEGGDGGNGYGGGGEGSRSLGARTGGGGAGGSYLRTALVVGSPTYAPTGGAGGTGAVNGDGTDGAAGLVTITFLASDPAPAERLPDPPKFQLTWDNGDGTKTAVQHELNTWKATPGPADLTRAGYVLLGWATSADFPADRARAATSAFDGLVEGQRVIFIPAGQSTFVTGENILHAIWGANEAPRIVRC